MSFVNLQVNQKNHQKRAYKKQWALFLCLTTAIMGHMTLLGNAYPISSASQLHCPPLAEADIWWHERAELQNGQEVPDFLKNQHDSERDSYAAPQVCFVTLN